MTVDEIVQAIDALSPSDRLRVIERAVHDLGSALAEPTVAPAGRAVLVEHGGLLVIGAAPGVGPAPIDVFDHRAEREERAAKLAGSR